MTTLPEQMRAVRLEGWGRPPELTEVPVPVPTGDEVLLRVEAAGLCHSDLHVMDAAEGNLPYRLPFTLGHEVVGTVVAAGSDVAAEWTGRLAAVHGIWSCGRCRQCARGRENYCAELTGAVGGGLGRDGGLADYVLVPHVRHLVPADGMDPVALAPLTDAGLTAHHALRSFDGLLEGAVVVVIGIGGLGHLALQLLARENPGWVVGVDPRPEARALGSELGAGVVVADVGRAGELVGRASEHHGADVVLDFVGSPETMGAAPGLLADGGRMVVVGSAGGRIEVAKGPGLPRGFGLVTPFWGAQRELVEVVRRARDGELRAATETFALEETLRAYELLRSGRINGRAVVVRHV